MMDKILQVLELASGYKTYVAGLISVGIGIWKNDINLIMLGLIAMGIRNSIK